MSRYYRNGFSFALVALLAVAPAAGAQDDQAAEPGAAELLASAQAAPDATPEQLEEFDTAVLLTLVDAVATNVDPAPAQAVAVEWVAHDVTRAGNGLTFVPFTVSIDRAALPTPDAVVYAGAVDASTPIDPDAGPTMVWDAIWSPTLASDQFTRWMALPPGEYQVFVAVKAKSTDAATAVAPPFGVGRFDLSVPDFDSDDLATSSLIRFSSFDQIPGDPTDAQLDENPYIFGGNRFTRVRATQYSQAGEIAFIFWVYGVDTDRSGMPDVGVEYLFNRVTADGVEPFIRMEPTEYTSDTVPPGFPVEEGMSVFNAAPLASFESGEYQLVITVTDRRADETVVEEFDFTVR